MQKQQVFKVKGMQRDASMANANGEFAYEILNMRLMPAEDLSGFSLTNEKGTTQVITGIEGQVIGQCPTNDSLVVFTTSATYNENGKRTGGYDYIYEIYQTPESNWTGDSLPLYKGDLNFHADKHIEALFNYETEDIQKVYWIDGINQLRCINLVGEIKQDNNQQFDSVKEINSLPSVEIERVIGGSFTAGVIQYYVTYFNKNSAESPIVYTSPMLYIAHNNRGANVNDQVPTAFKLTFTNLDNANWAHIRIYATHRTSIDATPEASIVAELNMSNFTIEFTDYGRNRTSIAPTDLYFIGGKFVKAGTMTVKDQVMFLGNLNIETPETVSVVEIQHLFDSIRGNEDHPFTTTTRKIKENKLEEYDDAYYYYKSQLNNTESITHYKYGEKYRFGINILDKYGNWSNPIWIKDAFIEVSPEQVDRNTLELPCPSLDLSYRLTYNNETKTLLEHLQDRGAVNIKPIVVFPKEDERKVIAQGVVCPTVYNLKDRKENGPYAQASWFMRPNIPADLWGFSADYLGDGNKVIIESQDQTPLFSRSLSHKSDLFYFNGNNLDSPLGNEYAGYYNVGDKNYKYSNSLSAFDYLHDDFSASMISSVTTGDELRGGEVIHTIHAHGRNNLPIQLEPESTTYVYSLIKNHIEKGAWVEFRHNYALRSAGWSYGAITPKKLWSQPLSENTDWGMSRISEFDISTFNNTIPVNRLQGGESIGEEVITTTTTYQNISFYTTESYQTISSSIYNQQTVYVYVIHEDSKIRIKSYKLRTDVWYDNGVREGYYLTLDSDLNADSDFMIYKDLQDSGYTIKIDNTTYYKWDMIDAQKRWLFNNDDLEQEITYKNTVNSPVLYGDRTLDKLNTGSSAYYVDNSIITLNSPDVELSDYLHNLNTGYLNFRIIGMIPLTATASDIDVSVDKPAPNPKNWSVGLTKVHLKNTNIGFHGFKGIVSANAYFSHFHTSDDNQELYGLVPLSPWHSAGTLSYFTPTEEKEVISVLSKKTLSNLRYSASSYYFPRNGITFSDNLDDVCYLNDSCIGWKPANGCSILVATAEDNSIYKLENLNYLSGDDIVYKSSIGDIIAYTAGGEDSSAVIPSRIFSLGQNYNKTPNFLKTERIYDTATSKGKFKQGIGASIGYKSSPHFVVGFKPFTNLWNSTKIVQETLPTIRGLNEEGLLSNISEDRTGRLVHQSPFGNLKMSALYHQNYLKIQSFRNFAGLNSDNQNDNSVTSYYNSNTNEQINVPNYGWLWLGEIYRETDPAFGGTSEFALQNNQWEVAGSGIIRELDILQDSTSLYSNLDCTIRIAGEYYDCNSSAGSFDSGNLEFYFRDNVNSWLPSIYFSDSKFLKKIVSLFDDNSTNYFEVDDFPVRVEVSGTSIFINMYINVEKDETNSTFQMFLRPVNSDLMFHIDEMSLREIPRDIIPAYTKTHISWTQGDTYYQRFDTLKTYAYSDSDQNSVVDITSFMVETRLNIDGRYDRNRGQESNLQMSPTNFNLMNDVYSQRDNFFTYRILDEDLRARTNFPNQITWSLTKTAGATVDAWMNITLASVLDLDGTKGGLAALKNFNNNIIAFQEKGLSHIMFNSRAQIATSEAVPIQIANTGKVDGQQYFTTDVGCQDKWNIVTTPNGLYFVDYFNKSIYRFNGKLEDISTPNGFRSWCYKNLNSTANILGYYDVKNKEVMYYIGDTQFTLDQQYEEIKADGTISLVNMKPTWLGFSELTGAFSSFYTYPKAWFTNIQDQGLWLVSGEKTDVYTHQTGNYNTLLNINKSFYGLTVIPRQDSNIVKTFNNTEFRADSFDDSVYNDSILPFDTISAETEYQDRTIDPLTYNPYRPSSLKKKLRTWRANIPRVNNGYKRFVNQWAKIGLWKMNPSTEKTILHDLAVWYSE